MPGLNDLVNQWDQEQISPTAVAAKLTSWLPLHHAINGDITTAINYFNGPRPKIPKYYHYTKSNHFPHIVLGTSPKILPQSPKGSGSGAYGAWVSTPFPIKGEAPAYFAFASINYDPKRDKVGPGDTRFGHDVGVYVGHQGSISLTDNCVFVGAKTNMLTAYQAIAYNFTVVDVRALSLIAKCIYDLSAVAFRLKD